MLRVAIILGNTTCRLTLMDELLPVDERALPAADARADAVRAALHALGSGGVRPQEGVLCSVVPAREDGVLGALRAHVPGRVAVVRPGGVADMPVCYDPAASLGADRYCGALAARALAGAPCLTVDCGTAITVNAVNAAGAFAGGAIAPGVRTMFAALHASTAQLPDVSDAVPRDAVPRGTAEAIRAGVLAAARGAVEGLAAAMRAQLVEETGARDIPVLLTGGGAPLLLRAGLAVPGLRHEPRLCALGAIFYLRLSGR